MSIFIFDLNCMWGSAYDRKYLNKIDRFIAHRNGCISKRLYIKEIRNKRDKKLRRKISLSDDSALLDLLPGKSSKTFKPSGNDCELPLVRTERYKRLFVNRCFNLHT